jgi:protein-tyrosine phosphatase
MEMEAFLKSLSHTQPTKNDFNNIHNIKSKYANWVIPGILMCGPTPGPSSYCPVVDSCEYQENMDNIIADKIDTFICLQAELNPETSYRSLIRNPMITILHYSIKDETAPSKKTFLYHMTQLLDLIREGKRIYIHCAGGHGRTSLYVACILACLYKEMRHFESVMYYVQSVHDMRQKQKKQFYGILPCMICCSSAQRELIKDFINIISWQ